LLSARLLPAAAAVCARLQLSPLSSVIQICRLRRIDGRAVLYAEHYLNPEYFPGILEHDLSQSLTELYARHYGIHYGTVRFEILPTALPVAAANALKVSAGSPGLYITRVNSDQHARLIDCDLEYWRHDAIRIKAEAG
jgi:DNA-binding GntR family transcriptional regulator